MPPIRFGVTGLGGFAGHACDRLLEAGLLDGGGAAQLIAVVEPHVHQFRRQAEQLRTRGVQVVRTYRQLLELPVDAVWLPLPIDLHRPYTEKALAAGKAVLCEKPAAGCVDDVDAMIAARDALTGTVLVGFQDLYQPCVPELKRRLLRGDLGAPIRATVIGCWPRDVHYFSRNRWVGRLRRRGRWVLDSPASNAMAHFLHLALFLLGGGQTEAASPMEVAAELYRANAIESYDTCALRYTVPVGGDVVPLVVAFTHACDATIEPEVTIECERGRLRYLAGRHAELRVGTRVEFFPLDVNPYPRLLELFRRILARDGDGAVVATLESARAHVVAVNAAAEAAQVIDVPPQFVSEVWLAGRATPVRAIRDVVPALSGLVARVAADSDGRLLHEGLALPWTLPAGRLRIAGNYHHFSGPHRGGHAKRRADHAARESDAIRRAAPAAALLLQ